MRSQADEQVSTIRFAQTIIGNLGAPLRDGSLEVDEDQDVMDTEGAEASGSLRNDEEADIAPPLSAVDVKEENVAGPSRISAWIDEKLFPRC